MSVWRSPSGRLHWQRSCSGGPGPQRMRRITVSRDQVTEARDAGRVCRCFPREYEPGRRAR
jgi:hypothetical protein